MPNFEYRALAADGKTITGTLSALSRPEVVNQLHLDGQQPVEGPEVQMLPAVPPTPGLMR